MSATILLATKSYDFSIKIASFNFKFYSDSFLFSRNSRLLYSFSASCFLVEHEIQTLKANDNFPHLFFCLLETCSFIVLLVSFPLSDLFPPRFSYWLDWGKMVYINMKTS